jgi:hypothetical protein
VRCFEDSERTLELLRLFFFFTLFTWTAACLALFFLIAPLVITFSEFLILLSYPTYAFFLYTSCVLALRPSALLIYTTLLIIYIYGTVWNL